MEIIRQHAFARAGLFGNPSDGFHGRTIAFCFRNFRADVVLYDWPTVDVVWSQDDHSSFRSVHDLVQDVNLHGYYGGVRLVKATIRRFVDYCDSQGLPLHDRNFSVRYESTIPRLVGLAGSSAIVIATLRALMQFYGVEIPKEVQPSLALSVETEELGIAAGLQDRVAQVYEGLVYMDFAEDRMQVQHGLALGVYESLDPALLPPLYIAYSAAASEPTEATHGPLRYRFEQGDPVVTNAMQRLADLTDEARDALLNSDHAKLAELIDENYDIRTSMCDLAPLHREMIARARKAGASAKFAGSGGAIVGILPDSDTLTALRRELEPLGCTVFEPVIA